MWLLSQTAKAENRNDLDGKYLAGYRKLQGMMPISLVVTIKEGNVRFGPP